MPARTIVRIVAMRRGERGATIVEYALLVALIVLGAVIALSFMGDEITRMFEFLGREIAKA